MQTLTQEAPKTRVRFEKDDPCLKLLTFLRASENKRKENDGERAVPLKRIAGKIPSNVITDCAIHGLIEFGHRDHSWTGPCPGIVVDLRDETTGKVLEEHYEDRRKLYVGKLTKFHLLSRHGSKTIDEMIEENAKVDERIQSFVRLTNEGIAATRAA